MSDSPVEFPELQRLVDIDQVIHAPVRLMVMTYLYVVESADFVFLRNVTSLSWGNLSTHLSKLEEAGYVDIEKTYRGKKPHTVIRLTDQGRTAFSDYKAELKVVLDDLIDTICTGYSHEYFSTREE
jgi:DNA-binding MarR family transcriptional regulator